MSIAATALQLYTLHFLSSFLPAQISQRLAQCQLSVEVGSAHLWRLYLFSKEQEEVFLSSSSPGQMVRVEQALEHMDSVVAKVASTWRYLGSQGRDLAAKRKGKRDSETGFD